MSERHVSEGATPSRQHSTAAVVLSRSDPPPPAGAGEPAPPRDTAAPLWATVVTWILLGGAMVALWALLLLGDSLVVNG